MQDVFLFWTTHIMSTPLVFRVDQGDLHPAFCCKKLFVSDDSNVLEAYVEASAKEGDEKAEALYRMKVDMLASWAVPFPKGAKLDGKKITPASSEVILDTAEAVQAFFATFDQDRDWIAEVAFGSVRQGCAPKVSFFTVSLP